MKGRFAPSPTGRMHLGNVFCALLSWLSVRSRGGVWLLRIEDLDPQRSRPEYAARIEDDLHWLGLDWDEGGTRGGPDGPYFQSLRSDIYEEYLSRLWHQGLVYPCYCTRADIMATQAPHESDGRVVYAGTCRPEHLRGTDAPKAMTDGAGPLPEGRKLRLWVPDRTVSFRDGHYGEQRVNLESHCGDFLLRRADGAWAYQLAVVVDDALMGVTEVVRGCDLLLSTPQQIYLSQLLGFREPAYCHHPLLENSSGQRLCKRDKSLDMGFLRQHFRPEEIVGQLAFLCRLTDRPEPLSAAELVSVFDWNKVPKQNICVPDAFLCP